MTLITNSPGFDSSTVDADTANAYAAFRARMEQKRFDPYYAEEIRRFDPRETDVLVVPGDVTVERASCGTRVVSTNARARLEVCGVSHEDARAVVASLDGVRTLAEARVHSRVGAEAWSHFLDAAFGMVVFAPKAVGDLERRVASVELVRFAGSPYEIVRTYWENLAVVTEQLHALPVPLPSTPSFVVFVRELHTLLLVGEDRRSFYRPASPILAKEGSGVGELLHETSVLEETSAGVRFVSGTRVGAGLIGGPLYHRLLSESAADPESLRPRRSISDEHGLDWGAVVTAKADADPEPLPWFCPPRPLTFAHFDVLRETLAEALTADGDAAVRAAARFHWAFVRLHPFPFANQSLAMAFVNHLLRRVVGAGMPHHVLDHLALRLSASGYERVFATAVSGFALPLTNPVERTLELVRRKRRAFDFLRALGAAQTEVAARALVAERPEDARLVLLTEA